MSADDAALALVILAAPAATIFPIWYGLTVRWWSFPIGVALLTSSTALALLLNLSLSQRFFQWAAPTWLLLTVLGLVCAGAYLKLAALVIEKFRKRRGSRPS